MVGCISVFIFCIVVFLLWGVVSPRSQWEILKAWQYKNRAANEPSDAAFMGTRIASICAIVVLLGIAVIILSSQGQWQAEQDRQRYEDCLEEHEDEESLLSPEEWCDQKSPSPSP